MIGCPHVDRRGVRDRHPRSRHDVVDLNPRRHDHRGVLRTGVEPGCHQGPEVVPLGVEVSDQNHPGSEVANDSSQGPQLSGSRRPGLGHMGDDYVEAAVTDDDGAAWLLGSAPRQRDELIARIGQPGPYGDPVLATAGPNRAMKANVKSGQLRQMSRLIDTAAALHCPIELLEPDHVGIRGLDDRGRTPQVEDRVHSDAVPEIKSSHSHARPPSDVTSGLLAPALCDHGSMSEPPSGTTGSAIDETEETYCYGHPDTPTKLRCSRCGRPICGRCAIPASVGQHCPECVAEARRTAPRVRSATVAAAPAVTTILIVNAVFFVLQQLGLGVTGRLALVPRAIADGEWWRLFTAMLLHAGGFHILMNSLVLWIYGPQVEAAFGSVRFIVLYLICGFLGSVASFTFSPPFIVGVGASGAIFGIAGVLLVWLYRRKSSTFVYDQMRNVLFFIGLNLVLGFLIPGIDYWAHIGGLAAGVVLGLGFDREGRAARGVAVFTASAVVAVGVFMLAVRSAELGGSFLS